MTDTLAVPYLYNAVVARFAAEGTLVPNSFGWREPAKQKAPPVIEWVPGDDSNGAIGDIDAARSPGRLPARPLATLHELVTVYIASVDATAPGDAENEAKQYAATRFLFDAWYRAVYLAMRGQFAIKSAGWVTDKQVRRRGATIRVLLAVDAMIPDAQLTTAPVDTGASVTTALTTGGDTPVDTVDDNVPDVIPPGG
jgi:hypothetical protein